MFDDVETIGPQSMDHRMTQITVYTKSDKIKCVIAQYRVKNINQ